MIFRNPLSCPDSPATRKGARCVAYFSCLVLAALLCLPLPAQAWNAAGHRLTAAIAWRHLDDATRSALGDLLAAHPDHAAWLQRNPARPPAYAAFLAASTWPDDIRRDARFHDDRKPPTPALAGFPDMARHTDWHYIDQPLGARQGTTVGDGKLPQRIGELQATIAGHGSAARRAWALAWLIHLVGDAHQPLHTVSRFDDEGRSDEGGNQLWVETPLHPRLREMSLHAYWDDLPGPPWLRGERLERAAARLAAHADAPATPGTVDDWLREGRALAIDVVYAGLSGAVPTIDSGYQERAQRVAGERVALAGRRLAVILKALLTR